MIVNGFHVKLCVDCFIPLDIRSGHMYEKLREIGELDVATRNGPVISHAMTVRVP